MTKEATSKAISLFPRNDENSRYNKLYQTDPKLILTVIMIFDIPLCNSKMTLLFFFKKVMFAKMLEHFFKQIPNSNQQFFIPQKLNNTGIRAS